MEIDLQLKKRNQLRYIMAGMRVRLADSEGDISEGEASTDLLFDKLGRDLIC